MEKVVFQVSIDADVAAAAAAAGLNVQAEAERAVRLRLNMPSEDDFEARERVRREIERYNAHIDQNGLFSDEWRVF